jgi:hypothetical protein
MAFILTFVLLVTIIPGGAVASVPGSSSPIEPGGRRVAAEPGENKVSLVAPTPGSPSLIFEPNRGQFDQRVRFAARHGGGTFFFTRQGMAMVFNRQKTSTPSITDRIRDWWRRLGSNTPAQPEQRFEQLALMVRFSGALPTARVEGVDPLPGTANYFIGDDPAGWLAGVPTFGTVLYHNLYPGTDLRYHASQIQLKYEFLLRPGAEVDRIALVYDGAERLKVNEAGELEIHTAWGTLIEEAPVAWQEGEQGEREPVPVRFALGSGGQVGFQVGEYDRARGLVIDPALHYGRAAAAPSLEYSTFVGGSGEESGYMLAFDSTENTVVTGRVDSSNFPTTSGAYDRGHGGDFDAFVFKLSADGSRLLWSTYVGGSDLDRGTALALDGSGNVYVVGDSRSSNFPTTSGAFDPGHNGGSDIFVIRLSSDGQSLQQSTFVGGSGNEETWGMALDSAGRPVVAGQSTASNFPTTAGAYDRGHNGGIDAAVFRLSSNLGSLDFSTYIGGSQDDKPKGVVLDDQDRAVITGGTLSSNFPTTSGAFDQGHNGGEDLFVLKLAKNGDDLVYSTYLGGSGNERGWSPVLDDEGRPIVTGRTYSSDLPVSSGAFDRGYNGDEDALLAKLSADGRDLVFCTYLGGSDREIGHKPAVDGAGNVLLTGRTASSNFPTTSDALDGTHGGGKDVFVAKFSPKAERLLYSTYLGGSGDETGRWLKVSEKVQTEVVISGSAGSSTFPTTSGAYDTGHNGDLDVFVLRFKDLATAGAAEESGKTGDDGTAKIRVAGKEVIVRPFDPQIPGHPLPGIQVTSKDYASHVLLIWQETCEDRPPPYYKPVVELLKKPVDFSTRIKALAQAAQSQATATLPQVPGSPRTDLDYALFLPSIFNRSILGSPDVPKDWDVPGPEIAPSSLKDYGAPKTSIAGKDFAKHMAENYPDVKSIIFYHDKAVGAIADLMADIYESGDKSSIAVRIRDKGSPPGSLDEIVATKFLAQKACDKTKADEYEKALDWAKELADKELEDWKKECVVVPDVKGKSVQEAKTILYGKGFVVEEKKDYSSAPKDYVTGQDPGPEGISECAMRGRAIELDVSRGAEPKEFTLYLAGVLDDNGKARSVFQVDEGIHLWLKAKNSTGAPLDVSYDWLTTGPNGQRVDDLSWDDWQVTEPPDELLRWYLHRTTPAMTGDYTFVAKATYVLDGRKITQEKRATFKVVRGAQHSSPTNEDANGGEDEQGAIRDGTSVPDRFPHGVSIQAPWWP